MKLYYMPGACSLASHIALEWIGARYETVHVARESLKSPEYLRVNPSGAVPALVEDDGWTLTENIAILNYLGDRFPDSDVIADRTPRGRAELNRWVGFLNSDVHKAFVPLFRPSRFIDDEAQHAAVQARARANIRPLLERIDRHLDGRDWLLGDQRSLADPYLYVILRWAGKHGVDLSGLDRLAAFRQRMEADPAVQTALKAEGLA